MFRLTLPLTLVTACAMLVAAEDLDYYAILNVEAREDATDRDIKANFRTLSKKFHPDVNPDGHETFRQINEAYDVLSDRRKRKMYDLRGHEGLRQLQQNGQGGGGNDIFAALFGGGQASNRGNDAHHSLVLPLENFYTGSTHNISIDKQKVCRRCRGTGAHSHDDVVTCTQCRGAGHIVQRMQLAPGFVQQVQAQCPKCGGKGKSIKRTCPTCHGKRVVRGNSVVVLDVDRGAPEGHRVVFEMEADESPDIIPGDVVIDIKSEPHRRFVRKGDDLEATMTVTLKEALVGFRRNLIHLDGHEVEVAREGVTQYGTVVVIEGEGMPRHNVPSEHGELRVTVQFTLPTSLSSQDKSNLVKALSG